MIWGRKNKYGAKRTLCSANHPHPSGLEASVCELLMLRERTGEIQNLKWQHTAKLPFGLKWKIDWSFTDAATGEFRFAEAKGAEGRDYKLKLRIWKEAGEAPIEIWKGNARRPILVETIIPNGILKQSDNKQKE